MTYTPTTQDMRTVWAVFSENGGLITRTKSTLTDDRLDEFDRWHAEQLRQAKSDAWHEGFEAGWEEHENPGPFVNDIWDAKTPNPYRSQP